MKEASGEANLTVVAIILIAAVVAVATPLISSLMRTSAQKACCEDAGGYVKNSACYYDKEVNTFSVDEWVTCCTKTKGSKNGHRNPCQNAKGV